MTKCITAAQCVVWCGDIHLWNDAKRHICEVPCEKETNREILSLVLAVIDSSLYDHHDFPEWFTSGRFCSLRRIHITPKILGHL